MVYAPNMQNNHVIAPNTGAQVNNWVNHSAQQVPALNPGMGGPIQGQQVPNTQFPLNPAATAVPATGGIPTGGAPAGTVAPPAGDPVVPTGGAPVPAVPPVSGAPVPPVPATPQLSAGQQIQALHGGPWDHTTSTSRPHGNPFENWQSRFAAMQQTNPQRYAKFLPLFQHLMQSRGFAAPAVPATTPPTV